MITKLNIKDDAKYSGSNFSLTNKTPEDFRWKKIEENMFFSLKPHIATPLDIQYIHLDEESIGIQPRKKWDFFF